MHIQIELRNLKVCQNRNLASTRKMEKLVKLDSVFHNYVIIYKSLPDNNLRGKIDLSIRMEKESG